MRTVSFFKTFKVKSDFNSSENLAVSLVDEGGLGVVAAATATPGTIVGTLERPAVQGEWVSVYMWEPSRHVIAGDTIAIGATCGPATGGKFTTGGSGYIATEAGGDNDQIEVVKAV